MKIISLLLLLIATNSFGQTTITDNSTINGTWTVANSPYIIEGRAIVPNGQTLTIEPGVEIRLRSSATSTISWFDYSAGNIGVIRVEGELIANGTESDPILFTRNDSGYWGTILIDENASSNSSLTNCIIEYAKESRNVTGISSVVSFDAGVSIFRNTINFENNELRNNRTTGLYIREVSTVTFEFSNNIFHNNGANGVVISESNADGINNTLYNNSITSTGVVSAINCSASDVYLVGNLIYNNDDFGIFTTGIGVTNIVNNTIFGNDQGIRVENDANTFIDNTIVQNNSTNFATGGSIGSATIEMKYSLTDDTSFPPNVSDVAGNILNSDAEFVNSGTADFSLQNTSPCIDNGNSNTTGLNLPSTDVLGNNRIENGNIDIGAIEFQQPVTNFTVTTASNPTIGGTTSGGGTFASGSNVTVSATPNTDYTFVNWTENGTEVSTSPNYSFTLSADRDLVANFDLTSGLIENVSVDKEIVVFPNPTSNTLEIKTNDFSSVEVCDVFGQFIFSSSSNVINMSNQPAGVYFLNIRSSKGLETIKRIVKK